MDKKLIDRYLDLCNFYLDQDKRELSFEDKPYAIFLDKLFQEMKNYHYFDDDVYILTIDDHLNSITSIPDRKSACEHIDDLIKKIGKNFEINIEDHYIIFPLQGSGLENDIQFAQFNFLTQKNEEDLIAQISNIAEIDKEEITNFFEHTKNSRSPDFLRSNMVIVKLLHQSNYVNQRAAKIAQKIIFFINTIHYAFNMKSSLFRLNQGIMHENAHVAILAEQGWRQCHKVVWDTKLKCNLDIDFLQEKEYQRLFCLLFDAFEIGNGSDELTEKFLNALIIFNKGIQQYQYNRDKTLALLLFFSSAESLIAEKCNEKRLRLASVLSRITKIDGVSEFELATIINDLYIKRNDFVHAGKSIYFDYEDKALYILEQVIAQLILLYFNFDTLISIKQGEKRISAWKKYIDNNFKQVIFGLPK